MRLRRVQPGARDPASGSSARQAAAVPIATIGVNLLSYLLLLSAARLLDKADYGVIVALLSVLLIATVPSLAVQTVAARRMATGTHSPALLRATTIVAAAATAFLLVISPFVASFLHLPDASGPIVVASAIPATTVLGMYQGLAQGARRFRRFGILIALTTGGRSAGGLAGVLIGRTPVWCLIGVTVGSTVGAVVGRTLVTEAAPGPDDSTQLGALLVEMAHAAHAHGAFLLLTSLDILLARHVLSSDAAGVFAAGSVVTRAALWLPQSLVLVLFASLADLDRHHRTARQAVLAVAGLGVVSVLGGLLLGRLVVSVVGGATYHQLDSYVWMFAALGSCLALVQVSLIAGLAIRSRARIAVVWAVAATDIVVVLLVSPSTPRTTIGLLLAVAAVGAVVAVALAVRPGGGSRDPEPDSFQVAAGHGPGV